MLQDETQNWVEKLGLDRLPRHTVDQRVTEVMDLTGRKALVTGAAAKASAMPLRIVSQDSARISHWWAGRRRRWSVGRRRSRSAGA